MIIGGKCTYLPSQESYNELLAKYRADEYFHCRGRPEVDMDAVIANATDETRAKNKEYFENINSFAIKASRLGIPKKNWHENYYLKEYGLKDYYKSDREDFNVAYYRRVFSKTFKPTKGPIRCCCVSYCRPVDIEEEKQKLIEKIKNGK